MATGHLEYLVSYGLGGDLGRFRAASPLALRRGAGVVVRTPRGVELGRVIRPAGERHARWLPNTTVGPLLRAATAEDDGEARRQAGRAAELLERGGRLIAELGLPVALLDAEVLLDGATAVLHLVRWQDCDVRELVRPLSRDTGLLITLAELGAPAAAAADDGGCGSCGSGGGCGSGGCGSCGSASPDAVRAHFAELRERMERRVPLL